MQQQHLRRRLDVRSEPVVPLALGDQPPELLITGPALAAASGNRKIQLVPLKELQALTGYIRGGVTALAGKKDYPVFADETIELFDLISISAGIRGMQILISPADYLKATKGVLAALAKDK